MTLMSQERIKSHTTIDCDSYGYRCEISNQILKFLLDRSLLYCCTLTEDGMPHITPIMYIYEMNHCLLTFLIENTSKKAQNLSKNPYISFTVDLTHQKNPLMNTGVMIHAIAQLFDSEEEISECLERLRRKYSSHLIPELVTKYALEKDLLVKAFIFKIVHWQGPFFNKFICKARYDYLSKKLMVK